MRFARIGRFIVARRWWVLALATVAFLAAGAYGGDVAGRLSNGGFADAGSPSARASAYLTDTLGTS